MHKQRARARDAGGSPRALLPSRHVHGAEAVGIAHVAYSTCELPQSPS